MSRRDRKLENLMLPSCQTCGRPVHDAGRSSEISPFTSRAGRGGGGIVLCVECQNRVAKRLRMLSAEDSSGRGFKRVSD